MRSSTSQFTFSQVPSVSIPRSSFKRDRTYKTTFDAGKLVPIYLDEVLPGDTFNVNLTAFARLSTPIVPFMDNLYLDFFFFYVPCRLVWKNWEKFNGAQDNPQDSTDYLVPQFTNNNQAFEVGSLADYFGLPVGVGHLSVSALPFRCYNLVYNCFFKDENFQQDRPIIDGDGPDPVSSTLADGTSTTTYAVLHRGKRKNYFTSLLPWPQKGPGVELPLSGIAPVYNWEDIAPNHSDHLINLHGYQPNGNRTSGDLGFNSSGNAVTTGSAVASGQLTKFALAADLTQTAAVTINSMRMAFQCQRLYERDAVGGSRYFEILVSHFGVRSPDARLQRPEYLGGGQVPVNIHTVAQTSSTDSTSPQGNLAAIGVAGANRIGFSKSFVEHGYIIGLVEARADLTYQQGIDRMWSRRTRFDFYWPALAHLGEQAVLNKEIFAQGSQVTDDHGDIVDDNVFGYQERWAEYRYGINKITGKLRSGVAGSLDCWHLAEYFTNLPTLSWQFIKDDPPVSRVLAVQDEPQFIYDSIVSVNCVRPMPVYSVPGLIDHF